MTGSVRSKLISASIITACMVVLLPTIGKADEIQSLKNQVQALQQKVDVLQDQLVRQNGQLIVLPSGPGLYDQWDPFAQMDRMERQMGRSMNNNMFKFNPMEDIKQTPDAYIINLDIPGMEKDKINLEVKNSMLIVSGDRNSEIKKSKQNQYYIQERSFGRFLRTMPLPQDARTDSIEAKYNNGVLTIKILRNKASNNRVEVQKIAVQ